MSAFENGNNNGMDVQIRIKVEEIDHKLNNVLQLLRGNEIDRNDNGLVGSLKETITRLDKLETIKDRMFWIMIGMTLPATYGLADFISNLLKHI